MKFHLQPSLTHLGNVSFSTVEDLLIARKNGTGTDLSWETSVSHHFSSRHTEIAIHPLAYSGALGSAASLMCTLKGCSNTSDAASMLYSALHLNNINNTNIILDGGVAAAPPV